MNREHLLLLLIEIVDAVKGLSDVSEHCVNEQWVSDCKKRLDKMFKIIYVSVVVNDKIIIEWTGVGIFHLE